MVRTDATDNIRQVAVSTQSGVSRFRPAEQFRLQMLPAPAEPSQSPCDRMPRSKHQAAKFAEVVLGSACLIEGQDACKGAPG
jgi:hypothetical protein